MRFRAMTAILSLLLVCVTHPIASPGPDHVSADAAYVQALRAADLFLGAWATRDADAGLALISTTILHGPGDREATLAELRGYFMGLSNPHHEAYEIRAGREVAPGRFSFSVTLYELYSGDSTGSIFDDTLEVVREEDDWRIARLPRRDRPE